MTVVHDTEQRDGARFTRRAWWSLLGFLPSLPLAFLVGEGLLTLLTGDEPHPSWWAVLLAALPALAVFAAPAVAAVLLGRRAIRLGDRRGRVPMVLALVVAGWFILLNGVSAVVMWLA